MPHYFLCLSFCLYSPFCHGRISTPPLYSFSLLLVNEGYLPPSWGHTPWRSQWLTWSVQGNFRGFGAQIRGLVGGSLAGPLQSVPTLVVAWCTFRPYRWNRIPCIKNKKKNRYQKRGNWFHFSVLVYLWRRRDCIGSFIKQVEGHSCLRTLNVEQLRNNVLITWVTAMHFLGWN